MSKRDRARRRRLQAREYDEQFGPDPAQVVYAWPDGWSVRWPGTVEGLIREGELLDNCLRYCDADMSVPEYLEDLEAWHGDLSYLLAGMHSLRGPDNTPHAAFVHTGASLDHPGVTADIRGFQNSRVKPEYLARIQAWHDTLPYPTTLMDFTNAA